MDSSQPAPSKARQAAGRQRAVGSPNRERGRSHRLFAALYDWQTRALEKSWLGERRGRLLAELAGDTLEIGAGTGANLPHYRDASRVVMSEPDPAMRRRLATRVDRARVPIEIHDHAAEPLPFPEHTFDTVVSVLVLCSVPDQDRALAEAWRVLRPGGRLVTLEHVRGAGRLASWQDRLDPLWSRLAAGCHPNRDTRAAIERAGFAFDRFEAFQPMPSWTVTATLIEAVASKAGDG